MNELPVAAYKEQEVIAMRTRPALVTAALVLSAAVAGAQRPPAASASHTAPPAAHQPRASLPRGAAAAWNGTPSKWGGSPPERSHDRQRFSGQPGAYIPIAVYTPYPVDAPYPESAPQDTSYAPAPDASVQMPVITTPHAERQLTTIEVYRLQPRFQKP